MPRDAIVVGSGPNGLAAAVELARAGRSVLVVEAADTPGGGTRSQELTLPGFVHDVCSTVHPLGAGSPFFATLPLARHGLAWVHPPAPLAHVLADGRAVVLERSLEATADALGRDGPAWRRLLGPFVARFADLCRDVLGPLQVPSAPLLMARFGWVALRSFEGLARARFREPEAAALLAGIAAHAMRPLDASGTAAFGLLLGAAGHAVGWPLARGGSRAISNALIGCLRELGGELETGWRIERLAELPPARALLLDVSPRQLLRIAGERLPARYRRALGRFRYGPGVFKMDWALREPIPWKDAACLRAATVHVGGDARAVAAAEAGASSGRPSDEPFVLVVQPSLFDPTRAPAGRHTAWAYCHVPHGSPLDASDAIEARIERAAPGFRDVVLARAQRNALEVERSNANYVGGDINGGAASLAQLWFRPVARRDPYATPVPGLFLCSASTPPGGGVHGMCGYWAARSALARAFQEQGANACASTT